MSKFRTASLTVAACLAACCLTMGGCGGEKNTSAAKCSDSACTKDAECCASKADSCKKECSEGAKQCPGSQNQN